MDLRTLLNVALVLSVTSVEVQSQHLTTPSARDTSFTISSTVVKVRKQFPFVVVAEPPLPKGATVRENLVYSRIKGRELHLDLLFPSPAYKPPYPAVVMFHGGGWRSGDRSQTLPMGRKIVEKGYAAVAVEYRLSTEAFYPAAIHDAKAAIRWLRSKSREFGIDPERIASLGFSAGGQMAAFLGTTSGNAAFEGSTGSPAYSSAVQAVIDIDGVLDFATPDEIGADSLAAKKKAASLWFGATMFEQPSVWKEASPITHLGPKTPPMAFINSALDRYHYGRDETIRLLNSYGIYSEVHTIPDTPHPFWFFDPWFEPTCGYVTSFLDRVFRAGFR